MIIKPDTMRIPSPSISRQANSGYALMITLLFLSVSLVLLGSMMFWISTNAKQTAQNELYTTAQAAAEAATEKVVGTVERDFVYQSLSSASVYQSLIPVQTNWPMQFRFSDGSNNVNKTGFTVGTETFTNDLGSTFDNLSGYYQACTITSTAATSNQTYSAAATIQEVVWATLIPLFQFAIFYNMDMDVSPGQAMTINGDVFCNSTIWMWPYATTTFNNTVAAVGLVTNKMQPNDQQSSSGHVSPTYTEAGLPQSKQDALTMPVGTNNSASAVEAIINLPQGTNGAPNAWAYTTNGQIYMFNAADLIISNSANGLAAAKGTNITIWYQDPNNANPLTQLQPDVTNVVGAVTNKYYSFVTNVAYYDYRESDTVQAVQIDVGKLNVWLTNSTGTGGRQYNAQSYTDKGHGIDSVFVYNSVPMNTSQLPAVRLANGAQLPYTTDPNGGSRTTGGLTVVTPQPLYVYGNYNVQTVGSSPNASAGTTNTAYTYPASLMGDAITILSPNWSDNYTSGTGLSSRVPANTTINAACLEGIVQSTNSGGSKYYSGGIENFMRLEEYWSGGTTYTLTYNGSIVVMFPSIYATNFWQVPGNYYNPPTRKWNFDLNFTDPSKLPPLTPTFKTVIRKSWAAY